MAEYDLRTGLMDGRQPELRNWEPKTVSQGLPALFGSLYANIPGASWLDPNVERRGMQVGHGLTKALESSPAGLGLLAHELGTSVGGHLGEGEYRKALVEALAGGAAMALPFGIGRAFGPGNRDMNIAKTLEAMAPGSAVGRRIAPWENGMRGAEDLGAGNVMRGPSGEGSLQLTFPGGGLAGFGVRRTIPQPSNDGGNWYPMFVK